MGRFATTAEFYEQYRPPYAAEFFHTVAQRLKLDDRRALIDLGTGPGVLALGFAPHVGRVVGVDPEPAMLAAARAAAAREGLDVTLIEGKVETLPDHIGSFDVVTIGRALHWMERNATLVALEQLVARDGAILVCSAFSAQDGRNAWLDDYTATRRAWAPATLWEGSERGERTHRELPEFFRGSSFQVKNL